MILKAFRGSLGLLLGTLGGLLGVSWELLRASGSTREGLQIRLGTLLGFVCLLLAAEGGLGKVMGSSLARFIPSRSLLGSILSSQTDPPTLKNDGFMCSSPTQTTRQVLQHHTIGAARLSRAKIPRDNK